MLIFATDYHIRICQKNNQLSENDSGLTYGSRDAIK